MQLQATLERYFKELRFARAAELAHSRRFLEAEGLLSPGGQESSDPRELDLLARMAAQQQQYDRARRLWEMALQNSSSPNTDYRQLIENTKDAEAAQSRARKGVIIAAALLALILATFAFFTFTLLRPAPKKNDEVSRVTPSQSRQTTTIRPDAAESTPRHESSPASPELPSSQPAPPTSQEIK